MRVGMSLLGVLALGALIASPARADEVVYFTNGTHLIISSHEIQKDMVSVDLGSDSRMGFPLYMVDKIESAGRNLYLNPTYHPSNQAVAGVPSGPATNAGPHPVTGAGGVPSRFRGGSRYTQATGVPTEQVRQYEAMWGGGLAAAPNPRSNEPPGEDTADRSAAEIRALQSGIPLAQPPQSLQRGQPGRNNVVRIAPRANPIGSGGGGPSGNPTQPPAPPPIVDPTPQPADPPQDSSQQNPPSGS